MKKVLHYLLLLFLAACQEDSPSPLELGLDYMPLAVDRFWVYEVTETIYFGESDIESSNFFYRDIISKSSIDVEGNLIYLVNREKSTNQADWVNESVYTLQLTQQSLLRYSDNVKDIPLVFPPKDLISWDANAYNHLSKDEFNLELVSAYELNNKTYQSVAKVLQEEEDDQITFRDNRYEVYAKGVGMIEKYYEVLTYCSRNDCLGEQLIDGGRITHLKLINNGQY
ncbi:hypothetical protein KZP23_18400 [Echinicola marina]|uniref:hypothetical protein n=1 Tax=Echinicola marina TaxID=2859768 RepID=UPI001CF69476|nr:hypothetical protein [Echinicola marina]UCS92636.1 hypothetical protein KZP23_18400 [Echinicola marina]